MATRESTRLGAIASAMIVASVVNAESGGFRIRHAEPIGVTAADLRADDTFSKALGAQTLSFVAYGRQFDLELEPNARLLNALGPSQRRAFEKYSVYRGRARGMPGSWVRIVRAGTALSGAIWDGTDLYSIGSAHTLSEFLDEPLRAAPGAPVVYRLSDTVGDFAGGAACVVRTPAGETRSRVAPLAEYSRLIAELQASAAQLADRQIEIAFIGDAEFSLRHLADPQAAAIARINIVDGIYAEQVGVMITAPVIRLFPAGTVDPFASGSGLGLLEEVSSYRLNTPDVRDRGLAHLFTGKDLSGNVVGVAFLGALCDAEFGVGLAEGWHPELLSALIAAHEIGHNFNAPHDGEVDSPCVNISQNHLMGPFVNFSGEFSQCSLNQMYFAMESAACIVPANAPDALMGTEGLVTGAPGQPFGVPFSVASVGTADIASARAVIPVPADLSFQSASVAGGTCVSNGGAVTCELGALPVGTSRAGTVQFVAQSTGSRAIELRVIASGDHRPTNDTDTVRIEIGDGADLAVGVSPSRVDAFTDQSFTFAISAASVGTSPVNEARVQFSVGTLIAEDLHAPGATCTGASNILCTFGTLAPGEVRQVAVRARSAIARDFSVTAFGQSANDANFANNSRAVRLVIAAAADAMIESNTPTGDRAIGETFDVVLTVASIGPQAVEDVLARLTIPSAFVVESATGGGSACAVNGTDIQCPLGTMPSKSSRLIVLRGRSMSETSGFVARLSASNDDNPSNDVVGLSLNIRPRVDVHVSTVNIFPSAQTYEGRPFELSAHFSNRGLSTARDVTVSATVPASFNILQASLGSPGSGTCEITGTTVLCTIVPLPRSTGTSMQLQLRANQIGVYTGSVTVTASNDEIPANNSSSFQVFVDEDVDVSVTGPSSLVGAIVNVPVDIPVTVKTGLRAINNVTLTFIAGGGGMVFESIDPEFTCAMVFDTLTCPLGNLPGESTIPFTLRLRFTAIGRFDSLVRVSAQADTNNNNNSVTFRTEADEPADIAMTVARPSLTATTGAPFLAEIQVDTLAVNDGRNVHVHAVMPPGISLASVRQGACSVTSEGRIVDCLVGTLAAGTNRSLGFDFMATTAGTYTIEVQVFATNDPNTQNNRGQITVVATPAALPLPAPPARDESGGGGGGALGWSLLVLLAAAPLLRPARQLRTLGHANDDADMRPIAR